jgi:phosphate:Na+ symporter
LIYNLLIGTSALFLISPYIWLWESISAQPINQHPEVALVAFHSSFNALGVIILLPFSQQYATLIERLIKTEQPSVLEQLDDSLLAQPSLALDLSLVPLTQQFISLLETSSSILHGNYLGQKTKLIKLQAEIDVTQSFIEQIPVEDAQEPQRRRLVNLLHALDHLQRLLERCEEPPDCSFSAADPTEIHEFSSQLIHDIKSLIVAIKTNQWMTALKEVNKVYNELEANHQPFRKTILLKVTHQEFDIEHATKVLAAFRWLVHITTHIERCASHLADASISAGN